MFECFTDRARKVTALANQEAYRFNHEYVGTEHLLLGLIREWGGTGAYILKKIGIDLQKLKQDVEKTIKAGPDMVQMGKLPYTPRAKKVIEFAIEEARALGHNHVGTEHLLLGLLREDQGVGGILLISKYGINFNGARKELLDILERKTTEGNKEETSPHPAPSIGVGEGLKMVTDALNTINETLKQFLDEN